MVLEVETVRDTRALCYKNLISYWMRPRHRFVPISLWKFSAIFGESFASITFHLLALHSTREWRPIQIEQDIKTNPI